MKLGLSTRRCTQRGMTLLELLIATIIGLVMTGGILQVYVSSRTAYRVQEGLSRVQENGRFAVEFLTDGLRKAGYFGCVSRVALLDPALVTNTVVGGTTEFLYNFSIPLTGFEATSGSAWSSAISNNKMRAADGSEVPISSLTSPPLGGTDVFSIRHAVSGLAVSSPFMPTTAAALHINPGNNLSQGDVVMVSDCMTTSVMQVSNANPHTSGTIAHNTGGSVSPGNSTTDLGKIYRDDAEIFKTVVSTFYLANGQNGLPSLWLLNNTEPLNDPLSGSFDVAKDENPRELVDGVENLQVLYGEDLDADDTTDVYRTADNVTSWNAVTAVRFTLLLQSIDDELAVEAHPYVYNGVTVTPADTRLRRVFTTTVGIRNRLE